MCALLANDQGMFWGRVIQDETRRDAMRRYETLPGGWKNVLVGRYRLQRAHKRIVGLGGLIDIAGDEAALLRRLFAGLNELMIYSGGGLQAGADGSSGQVAFVHGRAASLERADKQ